MRSHRLLPLLLALLPLNAQDTTLQSLAETLTNLRIHNAGASVPSHLTTAKHQLRDWIEAQLPPPEQTNDVETLADTLNRRLRTIAKPANDNGNLFGDLSDVHLEQDNTYLTVTAGVGIVCQYDESAYVYRNENGRWTRIFATEQNDYTPDHYKPQHISSVYIHQPRADNNDANTMFVMTLGNRAGCQSLWHNITYRVWRLTRHAPKLLIDGAQSAYLRSARYVHGSIAELGTEVPSSADVLIEYTTDSLDSGRLTRQAILHYEIEGDTVRRVAPVALGPRDFVDEWLTRNWSESAAWSESPTLQSWHRLLQTPDELVTTFPESAKHCKQPDLWQIALRTQPAGLQMDRFARTYYFQVRWTPPYRFAVKAITTKPNRTCTQDAPEADAWRSLFNTQDWR